MVLLSAQGMPVAKIAEVSFTSDDRVRNVIHNFNTDGFDSLYPKYSGGRPKTFTLPERREIKKIAKSKPTEHDLPFSTWSLIKLADFLVAEGVVDDISHEGLRILLREEGGAVEKLLRRVGSIVCCRCVHDVTGELAGVDEADGERVAVVAVLL
jgi:transposase